MIVEEHNIGGDAVVLVVKDDDGNVVVELAVERQVAWMTEPAVRLYLVDVRACSYAPGAGPGSGARQAPPWSRHNAATGPGGGGTSAGAPYPHSAA